MVAAGGGFYLAFSAGVYTSTGYSEGIATCSGPLGPCGAAVPDPHHLRLGARSGRRSALLRRRRAWWLDYAAWQGGSPGCTNYGCGAARQLFVAPITLPNVNGQVPCNAPAAPYGYDMAASDGGIFNYGNLPFCGSEGGRPLNKPVVGHGGHARRRRLLAGGQRRRHLHLRRRRLLRLDRRHDLNKPIVGMAATPDGRGYWLVASDGGIFTYGDAELLRLGRGLTSTSRSSGMAPTPDGGGYWLVASDGGIFSYGDATVLRLDRRPPPQRARGGHGRHARRRRLLAGGQRRRHLQLRRRAVLRLGRAASAQQAGGGHGRRRPTAAATGWWPATAASSTTATPPSTARPAPSC